MASVDKIRVNGTDYSIGQDNYSTMEQVIGTWVNGKPLYRITIKVDLPAKGEVTHSHGIANVDEIWFEGGFLKRSDNAVYPITNSHSTITDWGASVFGITTTQYVLWIGNFPNFSISYAYINLLYTKTTDTVEPDISL